MIITIIDRLNARIKRHSRMTLSSLLAATSIIAITVSLGFSAGDALAQGKGDIAAGKEKSLTCMGCHGAAGMRNAYPTFLIPKLGGQHAEYLAAALKAYKSGDRNHETMRAQAASLSDQDIADIAAYLASLK